MSDPAEQELTLQIADVILRKLKRSRQRIHPVTFDVENYRKQMSKFPTFSKELEKMTEDEVKESWKDSAIAYATAYAILKTVRYFLYHEPIE